MLSVMRLADRAVPTSLIGDAQNFRFGGFQAKGSYTYLWNKIKTCA